MAALHTAPDSPAVQLERAEDGSECDPDQEEEEEEDEGDEAEVADEEASAGAWAGPVEQVEVELQEDEDVEEVLAEELSPAWGAEERLGRGGDAGPLALQESGKRREPARGEGAREPRGPGSEAGALGAPDAACCVARAAGPMRRAAAPNGSFSSALQAPQGPAAAREEDLEEDEDEELEDDEEDFLTAGSQVGCPVVWSPVNQAGFPQGARHLLALRPPLAGQRHWSSGQVHTVTWDVAAESARRP